MGKAKVEYGYSVERVEFALLNQDGTVPSPADWEDMHPITGKVRHHKGGLVGKSGAFDIDGWDEQARTVGVIYGRKEASFVLESTASDQKTVTVDDFIKDFNKNLEELATSEGICLKAKKSGDNFAIEDCAVLPEEKLPFYAPIGFSGKLAELLGITGWVATNEAKSFKDDFEKEQGKSVDATSGRGVRCSIKDPDFIKGVNITISLAGLENKLIAMLTGNTYNEKTDEYYMDNKGNAPAFAVRYFCRQFEEGTHTKTSNNKMRVFIFPACQLTPSGSEAGEGTIAQIELSGSGGENTASALPMKFHKGIAMSDYKRFVEE